MLLSGRYETRVKGIPDTKAHIAEVQKLSANSNVDGKHVDVEWYNLFNKKLAKLLQRSPMCATRPTCCLAMENTFNGPLIHVVRSTASVHGPVRRRWQRPVELLKVVDRESTRYLIILQKPKRLAEINFSS